MTDEEVNLALDVVEPVLYKIGFPCVPTSGGKRIRLSDETQRRLFNMGGAWKEFIYHQSGTMPSDLQMRIANSAEFEERPYNVQLNSRSEADTEAINRLADVSVQLIRENSVDRFVLTCSQNVHSHVTSVPDEKRHLLNSNVHVLSIISCRSRDRMRNYGGARTAFPDYATAWVKGELGAKPTTSDFQLLKELSELSERGVGSGLTEFVEIILRTDPTGGMLTAELLDDASLKLHHEVAITAYVFNLYFRNNPEAWTVALSLSTDWEGGLLSLAETVCAAVGIEFFDFESANSDKSAEEVTSNPVAGTLF